MTTIHAHKVGLNIRPTHFNYLEQKPATLATWLEANTEDYLNTRGRPLEMLIRLRQDFPIALHGSELNIGSPEGPHRKYLESLRELIEQADPFIISDHFCWTGRTAQYFHDLLPLPYTEECIATVVRNIDFVQNYLRRSLVLENVRTFLTYRRNEMSEWDFIQEISKRSGCGLLLDLGAVGETADLLQLDPRIISQVHISPSQDPWHDDEDMSLQNVLPQTWQRLQLMAPQLRHLPISVARNSTELDCLHLESDLLQALHILEHSYESERQPAFT